MTDIGVSCTKRTYGRGVGKPLGCGVDEQYDAGLCYKPCTGNYHGIGPVCWGNCPNTWNTCGALCLETEECTATIRGMVDIIVDLVEKTAAQDIPGTIIDIAKFTKEFLYPICK